ncbi:MAG: ornithine carbamoyltransferase [Candidatus Hermodarchaeota archaeon]|nr:ornithine carbamoyltransferase [Candidatus Hermodarchaeota archaeon]
MTMDLKGRHLLSLKDYTREEIQLLLDTAADLKRQRYRSELGTSLLGKSVGMIFERPSTRTRVSFEVAINELSGDALFLSSQELQLSRGEPIADTSRVLSRYLHGIVIRATNHDHVVELAEYSTVPVINALTPMYHPCQALADLLTIREKLHELEGLKLVYIGDGNNVSHSLMLGGAIMGLEITIATPSGYEPNPEVTQIARAHAEANMASLEITNDPKAAVEDADVLYTDVFVSMGQDKERKKRLAAFLPDFQLNESLVELAAPHNIVMHCLPAHRDEEITDGVIEGPHSVVWDQAENRLHTEKAVLALLL